MRNKIKAFIMMGMIILVATISQVKYGNQGSLILGGMLMFGVGFGWYACKTKQDETSTFVEK